MGPVYEVLFSRRADKALDRLPQDVQDRIEAAVDALAGDPRPQGSRKMQGRRGASEARRIAVGRDYRVVYRVEEPHPDQGQGQDPAEEETFEGLVTVLSVGHRQGIYG